ncbi:MAG: hypothetical protein R2991_11805 [Thermoanaerobaculia bacterium]
MPHSFEDRRGPLRRVVASAALAALVAAACLAADRGAEAPVLAHPVLFVTQVPIPDDFATIGSVFANHGAQPNVSGRGGDLYIRYPDGTLRNLTAEAGYGTTGFQGADSIAVRDPAVDWSGEKAVFSMAVGAPEQQFVWGDYRWQLYEVTGLGQGQTASIVPVPHQPTDANNVQPAYGTDGRILFVSDRPRDGQPHLYPQHDEYESTRTPTGLWSLDPATGDLFLLNHAPSGAFTPVVDGYGRVVFTRWDHLQRDQQADADELEGEPYGTFNYSGEGPGSVPLPIRDEVFPEPRPERQDLLQGTNLEGHTLNHFFPWQIEEDGTGEEIVNHLGRHELHDYFNRSLNDDPNLVEFIASTSGRFNPRSVENFLVSEHPGCLALRRRGRAGVQDPRLRHDRLPRRAGGATCRRDRRDHVTHPDMATVVPEGQTPPPTHSGHYREPRVLSDGTWIAVHAGDPRGRQRRDRRRT